MTAGAPLTLGELLRRSVDGFGDRTALITEDRRLTYRELAAVSDGYARSLVALGVGKGTRVGVLMENVPEWVALQFAVTGLGAVLVPVSTFAKRDDLAYQLRHADVAVLVMSARFLKNDYLADLVAVAPELAVAGGDPLFAEALPALRHVVVRGGGRLPPGCLAWEAFADLGLAVPEGVPAALRAEVDPEDDCYLLYTSGTTANPKGVLHVHRAVASNGWLIGEHQCLTPDDVAWFYYPMFFSAGCINVSLGTLSHGAALILQPELDPGKAIALIEREGATTWHLWAHTFKAIAEHHDWATRDHSRLHKGTGAYDAVLGAADDAMGGVNMYGMTETCTAFSCTSARDPLEVRIRTQGKLLLGNEMKIVDPETGERLEPGEEGEICVRGRSVMQRYYKVDPATTFDDEGYFHTGDLGSLDADGVVRYRQRIKDMIKTGGINVSPAEVEAKLRTIDGVDAAYVFALPGGERGDDVGAAVVPLVGHELTEGDVLTQSRDLLAPYKRPRAVLVLGGDEVPMTGSGKVQTFVLRDRLLARVAQGAGAPNERGA